MYLSAQCVAFGASTPGSVSADIPLGDFHSEQPDRSSMENGDFPWNPSHWERFAGGDSSRCTQLHNSIIFQEHPEESFPAYLLKIDKICSTENISTLIKNNPTCRPSFSKESNGKTGFSDFGRAVLFLFWNIICLLFIIKTI